MKLPILLSALLLSASPAIALPTRLLCHETGGVSIAEANDLGRLVGPKRVERTICGPDEYFNDDCSSKDLHYEDDPYTIEFNSDTREALVERDGEIMFYNFDETKDQYQLIRKRRPYINSTYQSTGTQSFYFYSITIKKDSLASVHTHSVDTTDWGTAEDGGILYTWIINGVCKDNPF
mgnify:CR=1 FL=1